MWLTHHGFAVDEAANGSEAIDKARAHRPDVILMDLWMPRLDGFSATRLLKASADTSAVPVWAISAATGDDARDAAFAAGCDAFIPKPLHPDELLSHLRDVFRARSASAPAADAAL